MDPKIRSEVEKNNAERDQKYLDMAIITEPQIARQLLVDGVYSVIDEDHIKLLESMVNVDEKDDIDSTA